MSLIAYDRACVVVNTKSRRKAFDKTLLLSAAAVALIATPAAQANPLGGAVTTGSATVSTTANKTNVTQKSEDVVIDWASFNIGSGQTTQFYQPNAQAIAVNRVGGANASQILGTLDANGRVVLINGNGVLFGKGAQVNVGSLIATSTDGSDSDVLSSKFTQAGKQNAYVVNNGAITAASGGIVALVAPNVSNTGTVNAKLGTVTLGAANKFTVDFAGDGLVSFAAQGDVNAKASAINSGLLSGANVSMTAHAANGIATGIVNMNGIITAQGVQSVGGTIYLNAGNGTLTTTGTLNAAGATGGGQIETSGHVANISGHITAGKNGLWKVDPEDLTIDSTAAATIDGALNGGTSVLEQTTSGAASGTGNQTSGAGDINVESALSWNSAATLTLDSYHSINIDAPITIAGAGDLTLITNDNGGSGGNYFFNGGNVAYTDVVADNTQGYLTINGTSYELVNSVAQLASAATASVDANIAFANSYDAAPDGTYSNAPVTAQFSGNFEGLGNTISNLKVIAPTTNNIGLFANVAGSSTFSNLSLTNVDMSGAYNTAGFIGFTDGVSTIRNVSVTGTILSSADESGGLVGTLSGGTILDSHTDVAISGRDWTGGLVGNSGGAIVDSYATGSVVVTIQGPGGLVGQLSEGTITSSYTTGSVTSGDYDAGGLVGDMFGGSILDSYSLARVSNAGSESGGLVGGAEAGTNTITDSWAAGYVTAAGGETGGLVGNVDGGSLAVTNSYWDKLTTGQTTSPGSPGSDGLTTIALQASLPTGLNDGAFSIVAGVTYPYLTWQVPTGTPEVLAGTVYGANGTTAEADLGVTALIGGTQASPLVGMTSGYDGYYYLLLSPGTISNSGSPLFAYVQGAAPGAAYVANAIGSDRALQIVEDEERVKTGAGSVTKLSQGLETAIDDNLALLFSLFGAEPNANIFLDDSAASFNINAPISVGTGTLWFYDPNGALTESGSGTITAGRMGGTTKNGVTLNGTNEIAALGGFTNTGNGGFALTDDETLSVHGVLDAGSDDLSLTTTNGGSLDLVGSLTTGGTLTLTSAGSIWQAASSVISADTLDGSGSSATRLQGANLITDVGDFTNTGGNFYLTNAETLTIVGTVNAGTKVMSLETTSGDININPSSALEAQNLTLDSSLGLVDGTGAITVGVLNVTAGTGIILDGAHNDIHKVGTDTTNSGLNIILQH